MADDSSCSEDDIPISQLKKKSNHLDNNVSENDVERNLYVVLENILIGGGNVSSFTDLSSSYLDTMDLIRLMSVSKSTRRVVAPILNKLEESNVFARRQKDMLCMILRNPGINDDWKEGTERFPFTIRENVIKKYASDIEKRFVIISYERFYHYEKSSVAIFDRDGCFICIYNFQQKIVEIEPFACMTRRNYSDKFQFDNMQLFSSGTPPWSEGGAVLQNEEEEPEPQWREPTDAGYFCGGDSGEIDRSEWIGDFITIHYALIESLKDILNTEEIIFVLFHALTSDIRRIVSYLMMFFNEKENRIYMYYNDGESYYGYDSEAVARWVHSCYWEAMKE